jgi:hypothetical protein
MAWPVGREIDNRTENMETGIVFKSWVRPVCMPWRRALHFQREHPGFPFWSRCFDKREMWTTEVVGAWFYGRHFRLLIFAILFWLKRVSLWHWGAGIIVSSGTEKRARLLKGLKAPGQKLARLHENEEMFNVHHVHLYFTCTRESSDRFQH